MKQILRWAVLVTALLGGVGLLRHFALTQGFCPSCKTVFILFGKPADYYEALTGQSFEIIAGRPMVSKLAFRARYHGRHRIEIYPDESIAGVELRAATNCGSPMRMTTPQLLESPVSSRLGRGFTVALFHVPEDATRLKIKNCVVRLSSNKTVRAILIVVKDSDL